MRQALYFCLLEALHKLTGVKLKLSSAYHPKTDSSSECSNKTVMQALCYHIKWNQQGWARALPCVRFNLMNMVNVSTGFSPFQLQMGQSPQIILPITQGVIHDAAIKGHNVLSALQLIHHLQLNVPQFPLVMVSVCMLKWSAGYTCLYAYHSRAP